MRTPSLLAILSGPTVSLTLLVGLSLLAACGQPAPGGSGPAASVGFTPTPVRVPTPTATVVPSRVVPGLAEALATVSAIHLEDDWNGLAMIWRRESHFSLTRQGASFAGTAHFAVTGYRQATPLIVACNITIPSDAAQEFFALLATTPAHAGNYQPKIDHTDDYPSLKIALTTARGPVVFFSQSQSRSHTPWGLTIGGKEYIIDVNTPNQALLSLSPYLTYETLDRLSDQARHNNSATPTSAPTLCATPTSSRIR